MTGFSVTGLGRRARTLIGAIQPKMPVVGYTSALAGREWLRAQHPGASWAADVSELLAVKPVNAVVIATPIGAQAELAERRLAAGEHLWVEKSLATTRRAATQLIGLAGSRWLTLIVGQTLFFGPAYVGVTEVWERMASRGTAEGALS